MGGRLPTEAEWEYAARAGSTGPRYGELSAISGCCGTEHGTRPIVRKAPNGFGLYDMLGNVSEWTADWYGERYYAVSPSWDPKGPASGESRVLRGGSTIDEPNARASTRAWRRPDE